MFGQRHNEEVSSFSLKNYRYSNFYFSSWWRCGNSRRALARERVVQWKRHCRDLFGTRKTDHQINAGNAHTFISAP